MCGALASVNYKAQEMRPFFFCFVSKTFEILTKKDYLNVGLLTLQLSFDITRDGTFSYWMAGIFVPKAF